MPYLSANYKKIHYKDDPPANGAQPRETFILVHGLGSSQNYYGAVVPTLTAAGYRCVSLDTTGQGRSPYTGIEQSPTSLATDMIDAMDALSISKAVIVGHSMGGITVPQAAALWPDRVSAIVLLGPVYPKEAAGATFQGRIDAVEAKGMQAMADTVPAAAVGHKATALQKSMIRELLMATDPAGYVSLCRLIAGAWENLPEYKKIKCPTFIVAGDEDKSAPVADGEKILSEVGSAEKKITVMKETGHWMCVEDGEEVARLIVDFFKQIQGDTSTRSRQNSHL